MLIHVTECSVYRVWLSVIIPFAKTICCYWGEEFCYFYSLYSLLLFRIANFKACLTCVKLFPARYGSREQRLYSHIIIAQMAKFNVQSISKLTNRQGLVSQVDREVLVIHLYHLDLKI